MLSLGIDIGSLSTNAVLINDQGEILASETILTGASSIKAIDLILKQILANAGIRQDDIGTVIATGYGRIKVPFATDTVTEITCHAKGANYYFPNARTLIDIGGQDSKAIKIDKKGNVLDFVMNDKCAAGTGRFLEVMARTLEIELDDMGAISLKGGKEINISSLCTVFAESEVVSLIGASSKVEDICKSLHASIAKRIVAQVKRVGVEDDIIMSGGVAKNIGVVNELEKKLNCKMKISSEPQIVGALGAALIGIEKSSPKIPVGIINNQNSSFKYDASIDNTSLPKIGYFCSYIPVEIIRSAGFHPVRIRGTERDSCGSENVLCGNICPYIKAVTDQKLSGELDNLAGVVFTNSCDGMRRLYDAWVKLDADNNRFNYIIDLPKKVDALSINYFAKLIKKFKEELEKNFNINFSLDDINTTISIYNKMRDKVMMFLEKQWNGRVGRSGSEIFSILKKGIDAVPEKFSEYLTGLMKQKDQTLDSRKAPSIMLWGGIIEDDGIVKIIEDAGARVVADDLCSGSRYYDAKVDVTSDPYLALATRYLTRIPCSRMTNVTERIDNVIKRMKECSISGSIYHSLKFCDHNLYDYPLIKKEFAKHDIPILPLTCDYSSSSEGQIKTRVEAFVEQLAVQTA
ncbi:MAG: acyl-CoA dehydratase activase [Candidatus Anammoxibacter sp.]